MLSQKEQELAAVYATIGRGCAPPTGRPIHHGSTPCSVLIVESSAVIRTQIAHRFVQEQCEVRTASDGIEAVEQLGRQRFDAVVFDFLTSRIAPHDFVAVVHRRRPDTRIIVVTESTPAPRLREDLMGEGAHAVVSKPLDLANLVSLVTPFKNAA